MDILRRIIYTLFPAMVLTGCYSDFEPDIASTPVLCMNADIVSGEPFKVVLTRTWRWDEGSPNENLDITVKDATVVMQVNDGPEETLNMVETDNGLPVYLPDYKRLLAFVPEDYIPMPGDRIKLKASSAAYGDAEAEVTVPQPVQIERVETVLADVEPFMMEPGCYLFNMDMRLYFSDAGDRTDFYKFDIDARGERDSATGAVNAIQYWTVDMTREPLFTEHVSTLESVISETSGYTIFSDRQISGQTYPLHVRADNVEYRHYNPDGQPAYDKGGVTLTLNTISRSYYMHVLSVWVANDGIVGSLGSIGLGEIVPSHSNVSSGAGVVSARTPVSVTVDLWPLVEAAL